MKTCTAFLALLLLACSSPDGGEEDAAVDWIPTNPLAEIDTSTILPAAGSVVGASDSPIIVRVKTPRILPGYSGTVPSSVDVTATVAGDSATPADATDDWIQVVFTEDAVFLDTFSSGNLDLAGAHGGAGAVDGERLTFTFLVETRGATGWTREAGVTATYDAEG